MKIKRVDGLKSVFEIIEIDININISDFNDSDFVYQDGFELPQYRKTLKFYDGLSNNFFQKFLKEFDSEFKKIINEDDIGEWYSLDYFKNYDFTINGFGGASINKDSSYFNMGPHIDGKQGILTGIINLKDNPNAHTVYYHKEVKDNLYKTEELYRGPSKKGTGVFHINRPNLWHTGINKGNQERFQMMMYFPYK